MPTLSSRFPLLPQVSLQRAAQQLGHGHVLFPGQRFEHLDNRPGQVVVHTHHGAILPMVLPSGKPSSFCGRTRPRLTFSPWLSATTPPPPSSASRRLPRKGSSGPPRYSSLPTSSGSARQAPTK